MKKIVSVLALAALTLGSLFAEMSLGYKGFMSVFQNDITCWEGKKDLSKITMFDQIGEADGKTNKIDDDNGNLKFSLSNDVAGVVFDGKIKNTESGKTTFTNNQYYGWINFGNLQVTTGKYEARYVNRLNKDAGVWPSKFYEAYKPGFVDYYSSNNNYKAKGLATDADNLTKTDGKQQLALALAYTSRSDNMTFMLKAFGVDNQWGTLDSDGNMNLNVGFGGEIGLNVKNTVDVNVFVKSMKKNELVIGGFVRPMFGKSSSLLIGASYGTYVCDGYDGKGNVDRPKEYGELGIDVRGYFKVSDALSVTTMHNFSMLMGDKTNMAGMWNMLSFLKKINDTVDFQFTVSHEAQLGGKFADADVKYKDLTGSALQFTPAVVIKAGSAASLTTGLSFKVTGIAKDDGDLADGAKKSVEQHWTLPLMLKVSL